MSGEQEVFTAAEWQAFGDEAREHLAALEQRVLAFERGEIDPDELATAFRAAHTLKGGSATLGLTNIARLTHVLESRLEELRRGARTVDAPMASALLAATDALGTMLDSAVATHADPAPAEDALRVLDALGVPEAHAAPPAPARPVAAGAALHATEAGLVRCRFAADCAMPAVRALQIWMELESVGLALRSTPSMADVDAERVGDEFAVWLAASPEQDVLARLGGLPEVASVEWVAGSASASRPARTNGDAAAVDHAEAGLVRCRFAADCPMPAVRALQIWMELENVGLAVRSVPSMADVEAERVGNEFAVWLAAPPAPDVLARLGRLSDVASVDWVAAEAPGAAGGAPPVPAAPQAGEGAARGGSGAPAKAAENEHSVRVDVSLLDNLMNLVGELVTERNRLLRIGQELHEEQAQSLLQVTSQLARLTQSLQETVLKARMLPVDRVFMRFPRMVRDLSHQLGKEVDFVILGGESELDRSVIEAIRDPLVHILRNAVDHGIEAAEQRQGAGKPRTGRIQLMARQEEGHVVIEVADDGAGLDPARLRQVAVRRGVLSAERAAELSDQAALELIFVQGFSTSNQVSEISGRGVGMDVVRRNIESVGGRVELTSVLGRGTSITMWLPLTLATVRALLVEVGPQTVALPLTAVAEGLKAGPSAVQHIRGRPVMVVRGRTVPLLSLAEYLELPRPADVPQLAVLVQVGRELYGLAVDRLLGEQEVVAKALPAFWPQSGGIGGVAILADGRPALILDLAGVTKVLSQRSA